MDVGSEAAAGGTVSADHHASKASSECKGGLQGPNPIALLLDWAGGVNRARFALSVVLAVVGVAGSIVPYYAAGQMIVGVLGGVREFGFYLGWCGVAAAGHALLIAFHYASTMVSHVSAFPTISSIRRPLAA